MSDWHVGQHVWHTAVPDLRMRVLELNERGEPSIVIDVDANGKISTLEARMVSKLWHIRPEAPSDSASLALPQRSGEP